jgi:hypothetical protein
MTFYAGQPPISGHFGQGSPARRRMSPLRVTGLQPSRHRIALLSQCNMYCGSEGTRLTRLAYKGAGGPECWTHTHQLRRVRRHGSFVRWLSVG